MLIFFGVGVKNLAIVGFVYADILVTDKIIDIAIAGFRPRIILGPSFPARSFRYWPDFN